MKNLKISTKLYLTLILYSSVFIAVGIYWIVTLQNVNQGIVKIVDGRMLPLTQLEELNSTYKDQVLQPLQSVTDSSMSLQEAIDVFQEAQYNLEIAWSDYSNRDLQDAELALVEQVFPSKTDQVEGHLSEIVNSYQDFPESVDLAEHQSELKLIIQDILPIIQRLSDIQMTEARAIQDIERENFKNTRLRVIIIVLIMLIGPGIMAILMIIGIGKSIRQIQDALTQVSHGDLKIKFKSYGKDELGALMKKLEQTSAKLQEVISSVRLAAINMSHASNELSSVSQDVAQGASEQASTSEEIASSVEEMAGNIQQNSSNAEETDGISQRASDKVKTVSDSAVSSLERIVEISERVSIIGDIAFQTNILSLNAAVEAARAGEHGRGFGVVATEVGKLAERSKSAANEINELSKLTVQVTEESRHLLGELIPDIQKTTELVKQISSASQEQNQGASQINIAIQQLSMVTQQNAASSEEMATSAAEMSAQAKQLRQTMSFFSIDDQTVEDSEPLALNKADQGFNDNSEQGVKIDLNDNDSLDKDFVEF